jgi:hypothetical protein
MTVRRIGLEARIGDGGLHRHFLPQRFDSAEADNCKDARAIRRTVFMCEP